MEHVETVVVGAGQAGLATSYFLTQLGREHVVLEQAARPANVWRAERWDSFTLVTPNWSFRMPGAAYDGPERDGFMPRDEIVATFDRYVERFRLPVRCNSRVDLVEPLARSGYRVQAAESAIEARNVVIATGYHQQGKLPRFASDLSPEITQLHSSRYRNPESLPPGAVLVVGSAQSGCQIAEELYQSGRRVYLCTGTAGRVPRRYRGSDVIEWLELCGLFNLPPDQLPPGMTKFSGIPHFSGTMGGHALNLHHFARDGVTLLGHLLGATGEKVRLAPDLYENLAMADAFEHEVQQVIDGFIQSNGIDAPLEEDAPQPRQGFSQPVVEELDLKTAGIGTVIWAMGYTFDYGLVKLPVRDQDGFPIQTRGVTAFPGLSFVGMPWMPSERSGFLLGVGDAAEHVVAHLVAADGSAETANAPRTMSVEQSD